MEMNYCMHCGARLRMKAHETEGHPVPWCDACGDYRFPVFNSAVSMVLLSPDEKSVLLVRQYGRPFWILPAGYINQGEDAEDAVRRELREELGMEAARLRFNRSRYFAPSNTLMLNFAVVAAPGQPAPNWEVDEWRWFSIAEAKANIKPESLARMFLLHWLDARETVQRADSPAFAAYGRIVPGVPVDMLMDVLAKQPMPGTGMKYEPREDDLHAVLGFTSYGERLFADMPYQLGWCAGRNENADVLVRHGGSAFLCGETDFELIVGHRWSRDTARFRIPAHTLIELYGDTLRSAPLGRDFRILVLLPYATNTEWTGAEGDAIRRNTWKQDGSDIQ